MLRLSLSALVLFATTTGCGGAGDPDLGYADTPPPATAAGGKADGVTCDDLRAKLADLEGDLRADGEDRFDIEDEAAALLHKLAECPDPEVERRDGPAAPDPGIDEDLDGLVAFYDAGRHELLYLRGKERLADQLAQQVAEDELRFDFDTRVVTREELYRRGARPQPGSQRAREGYRCHDYGSMAETSCRGNCEAEDRVINGRPWTVFVNRTPLPRANKQCVPSDNPDDACIDRSYVWCRVNVFSDRQCRALDASEHRTGMLCGQ
ncbi:MAG: hypothetical protein KC549_18955 [Myxococcales bacterium]|nr:hypothetical protein [Myxococcales bacterium]